jgi:hypothetical protein
MPCCGPIPHPRNSIKVGWILIAAAQKVNSVKTEEEKDRMKGTICPLEIFNQVCIIMAWYDVELISRYDVMMLKLEIVDSGILFNVHMSYGRMLLLILACLCGLGNLNL